MYPMGIVHVYVEEAAVELARALVAEDSDTGGSGADADDIGDGDEPGTDRSTRAPLARWLVVVGLLAMVAWSVARVVMT
jgi:hypothetical protein